MRFRLFLFGPLAFISNLAVADDTTSTLIWRCWYDQQTHISCLLDTLSQTGNPPAEDFPSYLPPIVMTMRTDPGSLRGEFIHIPLQTEPYDMEFTAILAKSMVCGSRLDCSVNFTDYLPSAEEITALINKDLPASDPTSTLAMLNLNASE